METAHRTFRNGERLQRLGPPRNVRACPNALKRIVQKVHVHASKTKESPYKILTKILIEIFTVCLLLTSYSFTWSVKRCIENLKKKDLHDTLKLFCLK